MGTANLRILIVEDHADTARVMGLLLSRQGHAVTVATCLAEARARCAAGPPFDLMIADLRLPDGDCRELLAEGHACRGNRAIVVTGEASDAEAEASRRLGFRAHLVKPVTLEALLAAVERAMADE